MTRVLVIANWTPSRPNVFADAIKQLHDAGAEVIVACGCPAADISVPEGTATVRGIRAAKKLSDGELTVYRESAKGQKLWMRARRDGKVRATARSADVLVALDSNAVYTVWQLARRHRTAAAVSGLVPALKLITEGNSDAARPLVRRVLTTGPAPGVALDAALERADKLADKVMRRGSGRRILRTPQGRAAWLRVLTAPGLSTTRRIHWANEVLGKLAKLKLDAEADTVRSAVAERLDPVSRANWLENLAEASLAKGVVPTFVPEATTALLEVGDRSLELGDADEAGRVFQRVNPILFNRAVHFDSLMSPTARDAQGFLGPLHRSAIGRRLATPAGRRSPAAPPPADRPQRVLFMTRHYEHFLNDIREHYEQDPGFEVRHLDLMADPETEPLTRRTGSLIFHKLSGASRYAERLEAWLRPQLDWADTVFVDWCLAPPAMLGLIDPGTTRVIVRLHSYEAFTVYPHLLDLSRIDDFVFVSEPLRSLTMDVLPGLKQPGAPRTHVVSNAVRLERYRLPKTPDARFTLGLVGLSAIAKDPLWAFEVLRELRKRDERYSLALIGSDLDGSPTPTARAYEKRYLRELEELTAQGAVRKVGQTDDVPGALADVGVILSSSVRESFHLGLVEGAASGAVPVVRDWPFFAGRPAGAHSIFPAEWIVASPAEAADRVLAQTASEETWRKAGEQASDHALMTWDWPVTQQQYDRLFQQP
jgi:glycosyltransferase involved in cell wall biosynthesis